MIKQRASIFQLLEFINRFSFERGLQWVISSIYQKQTSYEICWIHDRTTENNWYMKESSESEWISYSPQDLLERMNVLKLDLVEFEIQLLKDICVQAVCSHYFIEKAGELIGRDKIESSIELLNQFTAEQQENINKNTPTKLANKKNKKSRKLTLVKKSKKDE